VIKLQVSKKKYIELINNAMQRNSQFKPGMMVKAVAINVNVHGFIEVSNLPDAHSVVYAARIEVDKKYWYVTG